MSLVCLGEPTPPNCDSFLRRTKRQMHGRLQRTTGEPRGGRSLKRRRSEISSRPCLFVLIRSPWELILTGNKENVGLTYCPEYINMTPRDSLSVSAQRHKKKVHKKSENRKKVKKIEEKDKKKFQKEQCVVKASQATGKDSMRRCLFFASTHLSLFPSIPLSSCLLLRRPLHSLGLFADLLHQLLDVVLHELYLLVLAGVGFLEAHDALHQHRLVHLGEAVGRRGRRAARLVLRRAVVRAAAADVQRAWGEMEGYRREREIDRREEEKQSGG